MLDNAYEKKSASKNGDLVKNGDGNGAANGANGQSKTLPFKGKYGPPDVENVDVFRLLDQLEDLPEKAKHLPGRILVNFDEDQFFYLVLKIRANLPDDMKKAQRVARDSERIVDEARDAAVQQMESGRVEASRLLEDSRLEATSIVEQAHREADRLIEQSEVFRMATAQAQEALKRAETEAIEIRKGADDYARDVLTNLEGVMGKAIVTVQRGRESLEQARG